MITNSKISKKTLVVVVGVVVTAGAVAFGQATWTGQTLPSATSNGNPVSATSGIPGAVNPQTGYITPGVPTNGAYLPPFGSPNSLNGAPMGPVGNTGTNQIPGVVGRNTGFGEAQNATGGTTGTASGTTSTIGPAGSGSPQTAGPLNTAPAGAAGINGYPNSMDPNGALNSSGATFRNSGPGQNNGTTSGSTSGFGSGMSGSGAAPAR